MEQTKGKKKKHELTVDLASQEHRLTSGQGMKKKSEKLAR